MTSAQTLPRTSERTSERFDQLYLRKIKLYKWLYDFTNQNCSICAQSGCACKDSICQHVEEQAAAAGTLLKRTTHRLRFIGVQGCIVPPHLRETCTIYLCESALKASGFPSLRYEKLKRLCQHNDFKLMELSGSLKKEI
jgi:hypothetical protein